MPRSRRPKPQSTSSNPSAKANEKSLRQRMSDDLLLKRRAERTHDGYLREVRKLSEYYNQRPDRLTEQQVTDYLLYLINDCEYAPGTLKVSYNGIKFFYTQTEPRDWPLLTKIKIPKDRSLPDVLSISEVQQLLAGVRQTYHRVCFWTLYTLGLRIEEGLHLQVKDIDAQRMMVHIHRGKGAKDRMLPLPESTLELLRRYWATHRNPTLLFPAFGRDRKRAAKATTSMSPSTVQGCMQRVVDRLGFKKRSRPTRFVTV